MSIASSNVTFEEMLRIDDGKLYELVDGVLVEKHVGLLSIWIAGEILRQLKNELEDKGLGFAMSKLPIKCFPWLFNHGRRPDVVYFRHDVFPNGTLTDDPVTVAPDVVVEVLSPNDEANELDIKIEEYLRAGVKLIWIVQPETRTVQLLRADGTGLRLRENQSIENEAALPGFSVKVAELFPKKPA